MNKTNPTTTVHWELTQNILLHQRKKNPPMDIFVNRILIGSKSSQRSYTNPISLLVTLHGEKLLDSTQNWKSFVSSDGRPWPIFLLNEMGFSHYECPCSPIYSSLRETKILI
ncbi:hypothetical protein CEXT_696641 [Caerostris extrusa]|uniref:Uncharacterized protein n=1 Tax=Caerostris extrusa TaxID=172846 RepID=A0AAV4P849_CAEEX|nr:hypothetical protein CEXT_696641 [Caerostris extrusa]